MFKKIVNAVVGIFKRIYKPQIDVYKKHPVIMSVYVTTCLLLSVGLIVYGKICEKKMDKEHDEQLKKLDEEYSKSKEAILKQES